MASSIRMPRLYRRCHRLSSCRCHRCAAVAVLQAGRAGARCNAGELARRGSALPRIRQLGARGVAAWCAARRIRGAGRRRRRADRAVRIACGDRGGYRHSRGLEGSNSLEYPRPCRFRCRDHHGHNHLARPVAVDRSGCAEHRRWRLSGCADPCFRGAKLNPAACFVAAPVAPPQQGNCATIERNGAASRAVSLRAFPLRKRGGGSRTARRPARSSRAA